MSTDLNNLDPHSFEHMINMLALSVLGAGHTGFGPGSDGGRDGYFEGTAPYPSEAERWSGVWYIQCKFHRPHLSTDPQKWLLAQIKNEINTFSANQSKRKWPDNYILATNIDISANAECGTFDQARKLITRAHPKLKKRFHIWGGQKIIDLLATYPHIQEHYGHFLTPGHVLSSLYNSLGDSQSSIKDIIRFLVIKEFETHQFTKLDQAGSEADTRPGVHKLFVDLPYTCAQAGHDGLVATDLFHTSKKNHKPGAGVSDPQWSKWKTYPTRAKIWFIQGGPGQGKSTSGQYFAQVQRAALILDWAGDPIQPKITETALEIKNESEARGHWHNLGRIPIAIDLKEYAHWFGKQRKETNRGVLVFVASKISIYTGKTTSPETLKRGFRNQRWFLAFDGLDEVPNDVKDDIATHVKEFINDTAFECDADVHFICTSRPQGYSGQFDDLDCAVIRLAELPPEKALECAIPVIRIGRNDTEAEKGISILESAIKSSAVRSLMTTPLQSHIMAVVVRDGKKPPERRWQLFENFYQVIKRRETNRDLPDQNLAKLLREEEQLLRSIHNKLGFVLHAKAETSIGAQTSLSRSDFRLLARDAVTRMKDCAIEETVTLLMEATSTRLVLVNTPDDGSSLRFDIRQLQEFFSAEYIHDAVDQVTFRSRVASVAGDSHWREVMHFLLSAMIEHRRITEINELVSILDQLNNGKDEDDCRALNRRLSRGALLAARLLQEGVLEQDKQIRHRFRNAIEPLMASVEVLDVQLLATVEHKHSRKWIIEYCLERLKEGDASETIGAAYLLTRLIKSGDPFLNVASELLKNQPTALKSQLYSNWVAKAAQQDNPKPPLWLTRLALDELMQNSWSELCDQGIIGALVIISHLKESDLKLLNLQDHEAIAHCIQFLRLERHPDPRNQVKNYEFLAVSETVQSWKNGVFSDKILDDAKFVPGLLVSTQGLFGILYDLLVFTKTHSIESYRRLRLAINTMPGRLERILPHPLHSYIPSIVVDEITTSDQFKELIIDAEPPVEFSMIDPSKYSPAAASLMVDEHPSFGIRMLAEGWFRRGKKDADDARALLKDRISKLPQLLSHVNILYWGNFIELNDLEAGSSLPEIERFAKISSGPTGSQFDQCPLRLSLNTHHSLIPHVTRSLLFLAESRTQEPWEGHYTGKEFGISEIGSQLEQWFPLDSGSAPLVTDFYLSGFRSLFTLLHPRTQKDVTALHHQLVVSISHTHDSQLLQSILHYVAAHLPHRSLELETLVSQLLDSCREHFKLREMFNPLLRRWREVSSAPVSSSQGADYW